MEGGVCGNRRAAPGEADGTPREGLKEGGQEGVGPQDPVNSNLGTWVYSVRGGDGSETPREGAGLVGLHGSDYPSQPAI